MRLYLETSVPNFLFVTDAPEKRAHTEQLFAEIQQGLHTASVSELYMREVDQTPSPIRRIELRGVVQVYGLEVLKIQEEASQLVDAYIAGQAFTAKNDLDAFHVAVAVLARCEVVVSWNFRHIVRAWTIQKVTEINHQRGLSDIVICTPEEVISDGGSDWGP